MEAVTVLGTGLMGAGMARSMAASGLDVTVWNRSAEKARPLAEAGITVAEDLRAAVSGADVVVTMLFDTEAVVQVMEQALPAVEANAVWVQSSTVGLDGTDSLAELARGHGIAFVDAPVLGTKQPAENGQLIVLAGGDERVRPAVEPVFDAIGSRTVWVGERPGDGHRLKLVANSWVLSVVGATAQAIGLAGAVEVDPELFFEVIGGGPLDCGYAQAKGKAMVEGEFPPAFALAGAVKDSALIAEVMRSAGADDQLMRALHHAFRAAAEAGHAEEDMSAVVHAMRR